MRRQGGLGGRHVDRIHLLGEKRIYGMRDTAKESGREWALLDEKRRFNLQWGERDTKKGK